MLDDALEADCHLVLGSCSAMAALGGAAEPTVLRFLPPQVRRVYGFRSQPVHTDVAALVAGIVADDMDLVHTLGDVARTWSVPQGDCCARTAVEQIASAYASALVTAGEHPARFAKSPSDVRYFVRAEDEWFEFAGTAARIARDEVHRHPARTNKDGTPSVRLVVDVETDCGCCGWVVNWGRQTLGELRCSAHQGH